MGVVYQALDPNLDLVVALKVMRKDRLVNESLVRRFFAEAKALGRLDHANIVRVYNVDREDDVIFIAMEFIEGESLSSMMKGRRFTAEEIVALGATVAEGLDYAHQKGIIHRDVKPSNILFTADGRPKITDFGIAHVEDSSLTEETLAGEILGTPAYMSPEQVLSRPVDGRSDLFSLGIILYELAAGSRPFRGEGVSDLFKVITKDEPLDLCKINSDLPKALADVIMRCLRKKPEQRVANGRELAEVLRSVVARPRESGAGAYPVQPARSRRALYYGVAGFVFVVVAGVTAYNIVPKKAVQVAAVKTAPQPKPAILDVVSSPTGAQIIADGVNKGVTPLKVVLSPGKHEVRLVMPGHYEWEAQIDLKDGITTPLPVTLMPIKE